jgi:hypothetical protein
VTLAEPVGQSPDWARPWRPTHPSPSTAHRVLTSWAAVVAEPLGHPPELALALGRFVAALVPVPRHGGLEIIEQSAEAAERLRVTDGTLRAEADGRRRHREAFTPTSRALSDRLPEVRSAMGEPAVSLPPKKLNRIGFRLCERFRLEVPEGVTGWGAKGMLRLDGIKAARVV